MKKLAFVLIFLLVVPVAYCSVPLTSVAILQVTVSDQAGRKTGLGATATYFDKTGAPIIKITSRTRGSWDNILHWWSHSHHATSNMRVADARRSALVRIEAPGCRPQQIPVSLQRIYEPLSFAPHGGASAHFIYKFEKTVVLQCG